MQIVSIICRLILAAVFAYAAVPKILDPHAFAIAVFRYQMLPYWLINIVAIYLPWLELTAAVALFIPRIRRGAATIILSMLAVFTLAIAINIARGINIACGCFSVDEDAAHIGWLNFVRNVALIIAGVGAMWTKREPTSS